MTKTKYNAIKPTGASGEDRDYVSNFLNATHEDITFEKGAENRWAIHARVSLKKQDKKGNSLPHQLKLAREIIKEHTGIEFDIYVEKGVSASKKPLAKRPEMQRLMNDYKKGKFKNIISYAQDRLFRIREEAPPYMSYLIKTGATLWFTRADERGYMNNETLTDMDLLMILLRAIEASKEAKKLGLRVSEIRKTMAEKGEITQTVIPYGYIKNDKNNIEVIEDEAMIVKEITKLYLNGMGINTICKWLNGEKTLKLGVREGGKVPRRKIRETDSDLWTKAIIETILFSEFYCGIINHHHNKGKQDEKLIRFETDKYEAIRSKEDQKAIFNLQSEKKTKKLPPRHYNTDFLLKGLLYCAECGGHFHSRNTTKSNGKKYLYYACSSKASHDFQSCNAKNYSKDILEKFILIKVKEKIKELDLHQYVDEVQSNFSNDKKQYDIDLENVKTSLKTLERRKKGNDLRLSDLRVDLDEANDEEEKAEIREEMDEVKNILKDQKEEIKELKKVISQLESTIEKTNSFDFSKQYILEQMKKYVDTFENCEEYQRKKLLEEIIDKIIIDSKGNVLIKDKLFMHEVEKTRNELAVSKEVMCLGDVVDKTTPKHITDKDKLKSLFIRDFEENELINFREWCEKIYFKAKSNFKDYLIGSTLKFQNDGKMTWWRLYKDTGISQYTAKAYMQNEHFPTQEMFDKVFSHYNQTATDYMRVLEIDGISEELFFEIIYNVQTWHNKEIGTNDKLKEINKEKLEHYKLPNTINRMHIYVDKGEEINC